MFLSRFGRRLSRFERSGFRSSYHKGFPMNGTIFGALGAHLAWIGLLAVTVGYGRSKNAVNAFMSALATYWLGMGLFWAMGEALAYGTSLGGWVGAEGFFNGIAERWWFHGLLTAFGGLVAISGALGRARFGSGLLLAVGLVGVWLPIAHHWVWNAEGWLARLGFVDFGGAGAIHLPAGCAALGVTIAVGPRLGRFTREGLPNALPAHHLPLSALGVTLIGFGWVGVLAGRAAEWSEPIPVGDLALRALLAHAAGGLVAMWVAWGRFGKPDAALTLNGSVGGIVAVSGAVPLVHPLGAFVIGGVGGALVVFGTGWLDRWQVDDVGGVVPIHALAGAWGLVATGMERLLFGGETLAFFGVQMLGLVVLTGVSTAWGWGLCALLCRFSRLRTHRDDELEGLDHTEHANEAYPDFQRAEFK